MSRERSAAPRLGLDGSIRRGHLALLPGGQVPGHDRPRPVRQCLRLVVDEVEAMGREAIRQGRPSRTEPARIGDETLQTCRGGGEPR